MRLLDIPGRLFVLAVFTPLTVVSLACDGALTRIAAYQRRRRIDDARRRLEQIRGAR